MSPKTSRSAANIKKTAKRKRSEFNTVIVLGQRNRIKTKIKSEIDLNQEKQEETEKSCVMVVSLRRMQLKDGFCGVVMNAMNGWWLIGRLLTAKGCRLCVWCERGATVSGRNGVCR